jgi:large repetitive protein
MKKYLLILISILFFGVQQKIYAQATIEFRISAVSSNVDDMDGWLNDSDPAWCFDMLDNTYGRFDEGNVEYGGVNCIGTRNPNIVFFSEIYNCGAPASYRFRWRARENDDLFTGDVNNTNGDAVTALQTINIPAASILLPQGTWSTLGTYSATATGTRCGGGATVTWTITLQYRTVFTSWPPGLSNNLICNAVDLGTLNSGSTIGNSALSNFGNFCADDAGEPEPWGGQNDQGVWFTFTTGPNPAAVIEFDANSDPAGRGDGLDIQLALYESSNNLCTGTLTLVREEHQGIGVVWDEDMSVNCLKPNTTYFLLVDGENSFLTGSNGQEGYFGLSIRDNGIAQAGDRICDALNLGTVPSGGQVATAPLSQSNVCATNTGDPTPPGWGPDKTVWFMFQAPPSGHVFIDANSDLPAPFGTDAIDLQLAVYGTTTGACTGTLQHIYSDYTPGFFDEDMEVRCLTPGQNYWLMVDGSSLNVDGIFDITISDGGQFPAPNDEICNAIPLGQPAPGGTVGLNGQYNYCANNLFEPIPSNWGNDQGVWYTFIAPPSGKVEIRLDWYFSDIIDLQVAVYDLAGAVCTGTPTELASEHDGIGVVYGENMWVDCLIPGREYWILVDGEASLIDPDLVEGLFDIEVYGDPQDPPAANNAPCDAIALGDPTGTPVGTTPGALHPSQNNFCADAIGEPQPSNWTADQTVWYTFIAPSTGAVNLQIISDALIGGVDAINLQFAVYDVAGGCTGAFREERSGDGLGYDINTDIWCLNPGQVYYLQVDGAAPEVLEGHEGYFDIILTEIPPIPVPANDSLCNAVALGNPWTAPITITNQHNLCADDWDDPDPAAFDTDKTVWYSFTTPATGGPFAIDIVATSDLPWPFGVDAVDLQLAVYESSNNTCTGILNEMGSSYTITDFFNESINVRCLEEGRTYFIMVDGSAINSQGYFDLSLTPATPVPIPTNDLICSNIDMGTVPIGGTINTGLNYYNFCSDIEPGEPAPFGIDQTVWFSFIAPNHVGPNATSNVTINLQSDPAALGDAVDLQLAVYASSDNTCNGTLTLLEDGVSNSAISFDASVNLTCLVPGQRYFIQVDGSALNVEGYFQMQLIDNGSGIRPTYNMICAAENLGAVPLGGSINNGINYQNLCADTEPGEANPTAFGIDKTVWFTFQAPPSGNITIDAFSDPNLLGDAVDLQLALYYSSDGTCNGVMVEVDSDYDFISFDEQMIVDCLTEGMTYWLQVDGSAINVDGYFTLQITDNGGTSNFPYNNDICNAHNFGTPGTPVTLSAESNVCANVEPGEPGVGSYATHTVWYQFIAPPSGRIQIDVTSTDIFLGMDPEIRLYASSNNSCTGTLSLVEVSSLPTALITETIETSCLLPGQTYFIQVDGQLLSREGTFNITIQDLIPAYTAPVNNFCNSATVLPVQPESCFNGAGTFQVLNYGQPTISYTSPFTQSCGGNCGDTWYQFTMPYTGTAVIEGNDDAIGGITGDYSDLVVIAYTGTCGALVPLDCEMGGLGNDVGYQVAATPGSTVWLQVFDNGGNDENENYELCVSIGCGFDNCLDALIVPMLPNIPYCFNTSSAEPENVAAGEPGYFECSEGDNPEHSIYYYFETDCNGSAVTLSIIDGQINGSCILGITPTDGFNISLFQDATPCDNNPDALVDCQIFTACEALPINWSFTYTGLAPNTPYVIQIDGGFGSFGGNNTGQIMITTSTSPLVSPNSTPASCAVLGTATATTFGGSYPYTYQWSNGATDSLVSGLNPGMYYVTLTGANGCVETDSVFVADSTFMSATIVSSVNPGCFNGTDGEITAGGIGGAVTTGYTYLWDSAAGAQTTATATGLAAGTYSVTVFDNGLCSDTISFSLTQPSPVDLSLITSNNPSCNSSCDGQAIVSAGGGDISGTGSYTFIWPGGQSTALVTGLCSGSYLVTVTDDNGCSDSLTVNITAPALLTASPIQISGSDCDSLLCTGSANAGISGGSAPYTYLWSSGSTSAAPNNLCPGINTVTITDGNNCTATATLPISTPTASTAPIIGPVPGANCPNTTVTLSASGGVAGTGSTINWYSAPGGVGLLGTGDSLIVTTDSTRTFYVRREGLCNNSAEDSVTLAVKYYIYAWHNASTNQYCTDNNGWHHFYIGEEIILSLRGDLSGAAPGSPLVTITNDATYHQETEGPFTPADCINGWSPGEERFEMNRAWDISFAAGSTLSAPYEVRFYHRPAERQAIENAAIAHMAAYPACGYTYKYPYPLGFYWFKNTSGFYRNTPIYDGIHLMPSTNALTPNGVNYDQLAGITSFSGGSGAVILIPNAMLPVDWLYFKGETDNKYNFLSWATETELNTAYFNVQRSQNGMDFHNIGLVNAQGNSTVQNDYIFTDQNPFRAENYYRLELVDNNGEKSYSNIILLYIYGEGPAYNFYPNPTNDIVFYQFEAEVNEQLQIEVIDVLGRTLLKKDVNTESGINNIPVSLEDYPSGSYLVRVHHKSTGAVHLTKIIKKDR